MTVNAVTPKKKRSFLQRMRGNWDLLFFCLPGIVFTIIYHYIPIYGVQIAFRNYKMKKGIWGSDWVGLKNFAKFFNSADWFILVRNTTRDTARSSRPSPTRRTSFRPSSCAVC